MVFSGKSALISREFGLSIFEAFIRNFGRLSMPLTGSIYIFLSLYVRLVCLRLCVFHLPEIPNERKLKEHNLHRLFVLCGGGDGTRSWIQAVGIVNSV